ncbi:MAG: cellulase family glycosylhydrolase [Pirellulales bacterium]|nr:cellulase family glycosylhydrolase [Pirellulales bacterium]
MNCSRAMALLRCGVLSGLVVLAGIGFATARDRWSADEAQAWQQRAGWLVGCNYLPRTAINQLEMWQADSFVPEVIDQELGWAQGLGFNSVRVFLHHLLWEQDAEGFARRLDQFLEIADRHDIGVMLVLFDGVWDPHPKLGPQRAPKPHIHNSGWVQSPGADVLRDDAQIEALKPYVLGIVSRYKSDPRVQVWDLFNEPDNPNANSYGAIELKDKAQRAQVLLEKTFAWARSADPQAPLTAGVWRGDWSSDERMSPIDRAMTSASDVISFHTYDPPPVAAQRLASLRRFGRPLLCTEYMARGNGSRFDPQLGNFRDAHVAAYCWGFVAGKSQTIYPWDSWQKSYRAEPEEWFHDIFRGDGSPYRPAEVEYIRQTTQQRQAAAN